MSEPKTIESTKPGIRKLINGLNLRLAELNTESGLIRREIDALEAAYSLKFPDYQSLSLRERTVLENIALGQSNKEIAVLLGISVTTVKAHVRAIMQKLNAKNRVEAVAKMGSRT